MKWPESKKINSTASRLLLAVAAIGLAAWLATTLHRRTPLPEADTPSYGDLRDKGRDPLRPLTGPAQVSPELAALGRRLFFDPRLSADDSIACVSCHDLNKGGTDRRQFSIGIGGAVGGINAPTVFNSALNFVQFWDGRAATLEMQVSGPVHNPLEMGSNWPQVIGKLQDDPGYREAFGKLFPDGLKADNIITAVAAFERTLITVNSRFDRFAQGDVQALDATEQRGYRLFLDYGCASCHQGSNLGGNMFQRFGVMEDYFQGKTPSEADLGRYNVTRREEDRHVFKVPSLRNVALTAPYFHNGSVDNLEEAVTVMARYQLGRTLPRDDVRAIVAFLGSLNGEWEGKTLQ